MLLFSTLPNEHSFDVFIRCMNVYPLLLFFPHPYTLAKEVDCRTV